MANISLTKTTPLIRRINTGGGGTFYVFSSAAEDLTLSITETANRKFAFSKFALLNIPDILTDPSKNTLKLKALPGAYFNVDMGVSTDWNFHLAESFQNYCLNLETTILSNANYRSDLPLTVSERVFWKWLKEMGGIRFKESSSSTGTQTFYEEEDLSSNYNPVVRYMGNIDFFNNLAGTVNSYTEVYVHIPTEVGNTSQILFKIPKVATPTTEEPDTDPYNFIPDTRFTISSEYLAGHDALEIHPDSLRINAFYDNDLGNPLLAEDNTTPIWLYKRPTNVTSEYVKDYNSNRDGDNWWYDNTTLTNQYILEESFTDPSNDYLAVSDIEILTEDDETFATKIIRSRLEGVCLDWNINDYDSLSDLQNVKKTFLELSRQEESGDFEFNAVLVYYDLFESSSTLSSTATPLATNLFGILFLDNVEATSLGGGTIPKFTKCRPNEIFNLNGNSYGFKINIKLNTSPITSGVEVESIISDSNTLSMDIYSQALSEMMRVSDGIVNNELKYLSLDKRLRSTEESLRALFNGTHLAKFLDSYIQLQQRVSNLEQYTPTNTTPLAERINKLQEDLDSLISGKTSVSLITDFNLFRAGAGISLANNNNQLTIKALNSTFNYADIKVVKSSDFVTVNTGSTAYLTITTELKNFKNYLRFSEVYNKTTFIPNKTIRIYIDDTKLNWLTGQTFRFYFDTPYDLATYSKNFEIYSFKDGNGNYYKNPIVKVTFQEFQMRNGLPVFEIHCYDITNKNFFLDFLN